MEFYPLSLGSVNITQSIQIPKLSLTISCFALLVLSTNGVGAKITPQVVSHLSMHPKLGRVETIKQLVIHYLETWR